MNHLPEVLPGRTTSWREGDSTSGQLSLWQSVFKHNESRLSPQLEPLELPDFKMRNFEVLITHFCPSPATGLTYLIFNLKNKCLRYKRSTIKIHFEPP